MKRFVMLFLMSVILFPVCAGAADLGGMRFSLIRGDVQVRNDDTGDWVPASINMPLREGDRIWAPEEGIAEIQTKDGSYFRLAEKTALEILSLDSDSYQAYLTEGRLYAYFRGNRDSVLQIDTLTSSVRAYEKSKFKVDVPERGPVRFSVLQGEVMVENREGRMTVASGEMLSLGEGAYSEKSTLGSPDDWERWNWDRDREIAERRPPARYLPEELQPYSSDFYDDGRWVNTPDYGYVWTPTVAVSVGWAPYRAGRWVWMGGDYVWVSYEPWGWVPYHYGRWAFVVSIGWCWVPPVRGAVYWGPGYVGWVYTPSYVAWVPLAPREIYYGRGHYGPYSVNITNINVTNVHVDKVVYKNVRVSNGVTTVNHDTFVRGRPAEAHVKDNPFLTERVHLGGPPIKPGKTSAMPVVREVPQTKRPPEPVRQVNVRELKERRPMVKSQEASVFAPETRPREMPVKQGETKPVQKSSERAKELRQPPAPSSSPSVRSQEKGQDRPASRGSGRSAPSEPAVKTPKETTPTVRGTEPPAPSSSPSVRSQEKGQGRPSNRGSSPAVPSEPAARAPKEMRTPERGTDRRMESRPPEKGIERTRPPERVQPKGKETSPPENVIQPAPEPRTPEKRTERPGRGPRNSEKGA